MQAPLVLFVFNRPEHVTVALEHISRLRNSENTDFFIFCDAARNDGEVENVNRVRAVVREFAGRNLFRNTTLIEAETNKGLAKSIIEGVSGIMDRYGTAIVLEDDLIVSRDFLDYMNLCLEYYRDNRKIWSVSGYTFPMSSVASGNHDIYFSGRGCSWGWATWKDRWDTVDWTVSDYDTIRFNARRRRGFAQWGRDMPTMLDHCMAGNVKSWAIRWCYEEWKQDCYTVFPGESRIRNIGTDGSGTNFRKKENKFDTVLKEDHDAPVLEAFYLDPAIRKEFQSKYSSRLHAFLSSMYSLLFRLKTK